VQDVYDKRLLHRLVGVLPRATVTEEVAHLNGTVRSQGDETSIVQSAWEPTERSRESDDEEQGGKAGSITKARSRKVIDVEEQSRYDIPRKKRRKTDEVIEVETVFTTDSGSEEGNKGERVKINRKRAFWASKAAVAVAGLGTGSVASLL
jgi:non-canonical poly(A) RNA polymerase PAPD5/7